MEKNAIDTVTDIFFKKQDASEKKLKEAFKLINENLAVVIAQSQPSPQDISSNHRTLPRPQSSPEPSTHASLSRFQCAICGKSFGSSRELTNHERKEHQTESQNAAADSFTRIRDVY